MMGWGWGYGMGAGMWLSWVVLVLVVGIVVYLVVRASGSEAGHPRTGGPARRPTAFEILADRYARGEIGTEEYEERLSHLSS